MPFFHGYLIFFWFIECLLGHFPMSEVNLNIVNPLQEVHDNPKVPNPIAEQISVHAHCKLTEEKPNDNKIVASDTEAEVASLKRQPTLQSLDIAKQPKPSLKQGT